MTAIDQSMTLEATLVATGTRVLAINQDNTALLVTVLRFFDSGIDCTIENSEAMRIVAGNINATYCLRHLPTGRMFIIQRLNTIFDLDAIDNNLQWLEEAQERSRDLLPAHWQTVGYLNVAGQGKKKIYYDADGSGWRVMQFVPGAIKIYNSFNEVPEEMRANVAQSLGEAIAVFGRMLEAVPPTVWKQPLPNFHNAHYHLEYYQAIMRGETVNLSLSRDAGRVVTKQPEIMAKYAERIQALAEKVDARTELVSALDSLGQIVAHGDTKINNFVFRPDTDGRMKCICLIDLDTVQPGNLLDDLGDALRSAGNPAGEEPADINTVRIGKSIVQQIVGGYLEKMRAFFGEERAQQLHTYALDSFKLFLYVQCARFFADALVGNEYFKPKPGQHEDINLYRAEVQMRALEELERTVIE